MKETGYKASQGGGGELSLIVYDLLGEKRDKVQRAVELVRGFEPPDKYYLACGEFAASFGGVKFSPFGTNLPQAKFP